MGAGSCFALSSTGVSFFAKNRFLPEEPISYSLKIRSKKGVVGILHGPHKKALSKAGDEEATCDSIFKRILTGRTLVKFCIASKYEQSANGAMRVVRVADSRNELLEQLRKAMEVPGWSDSLLVNAETLPSPAKEEWQEEAQRSRKRVS